jgi:hypothetical protein
MNSVADMGKRVETRFNVFALPAGEFIRRANRAASQMKPHPNQ